MSWHAVDALDRAVDATRRFLFPFEAVRWAKLAFLALVMAGGSSGVSGTGSSSLGAPAGGIGVWSEFVPAESESVPAGVDRAVGAGAERLAGVDAALLAGVDAALLAGVAVGALLVAVALVACSIAFQLAFYDALATTEVRIWRPFRDRFRQALGLLGFATALAVATGTPAVAFAAAIDPALVRVLGVSPGGFAGLSTAATVALGVFSVVTGLVGVLVGRLTFEFVAPAMVARDVGVLAGWRRVWTSVRGSWMDVVAYLAVHAVVAVGVGFAQAVAVAFASGVVAVVVLVALVLAAVPLGGLGALTGTTAGAVVLGVVLVSAVAAVAVLAVPVRLVARTYLTAYEVSTLAGIDPDSAPLAAALSSNGDGHR
ncbi:hypothetical protein [Halorubrum sp. 2020YC2]|uniref:DUF7544 domain-containing protein n=1 Tax=Halorubrum sp. 2020YC2 TaxID=2836432 RepID=UPI001BEC830E|nr:hypothetical protein [Halorubrum sp. 2020YC2]QWC20611.1 hypothetical protein KI388_06660 [Halorubrum sp. 2020YC2]